MTNTNGNRDRLDRIENALFRLTEGLEETRQIANSNSRTIQALLEQQATDRLNREEERAEQQRRMASLEEIASRLTEVQLGMARMLGNIDETNPTILRRLMASL